MTHGQQVSKRWRIKRIGRSRPPMRLDFIPYKTGVHLVLKSWSGIRVRCGWVVGWTPGEPFPADCDWSMTIVMADGACDHGMLKLRD